MDPRVIYWRTVLAGCVFAARQSCPHLIVAVQAPTGATGSTQEIQGPGSPVGVVTRPGKLRLSTDDLARWAVSKLAALGVDVFTQEDP